LKAGLRIRIRIWTLGSGAFWIPGSGIRDGKKSVFVDPGSGISIPHHISKSLVTIFGLKILKIFVEYSDLGSSAYLTLDPGLGMEELVNRIRDLGCFSRSRIPRHCLEKIRVRFWAVLTPPRIRI